MTETFSLDEPAVDQILAVAESAPEGRKIEIDREILRQLCNGWIAWANYQ